MKIHSKHVASGEAPAKPKTARNNLLMERNYIVNSYLETISRSVCLVSGKSVSNLSSNWKRIGYATRRELLCVQPAKYEMCLQTNLIRLFPISSPLLSLLCVIRIILRRVVGGRMRRNQIIAKEPADNFDRLLPPKENAPRGRANPFI